MRREVRERPDELPPSDGLSDRYGADHGLEAAASTVRMAHHDDGPTGHRSRERHDPPGRSEYGRAVGGSKVDAPVAGGRLAIGAHVGAKRRAISAHRSQHGLVVRDDPGGFVLPRALLHHFEEPWEVFLRPGPEQAE